MLMAGMPNGSGGMDEGAWLEEWTAGGNNLSQLATRDQAAVENYYKSQIQESNPWKEASDKFWADIMAGFEDLNSFLALLVNAITGQEGGWEALAQYFADQWQLIAESFEAAWDWLVALIEDLFVLLDLLHLIYPLGSPGDARDRTISGKRTWYSAWNDLMYLLGLAKEGTVTEAEAANARTLVDGISTKTDKNQDAFAWLANMFKNQPSAKPTNPSSIGSGDPLATSLQNAWDWFAGLMGWQKDTEIANSRNEAYGVGVGAALEDIQTQLDKIQQAIAEGPPGGGTRFEDQGYGSTTASATSSSTTGFGTGWYSSGSPSVSGVGAGSVQRSSSHFQWVKSGSGRRKVTGVYTAEAALSDTYTVSLVINGTETKWFNVPSPDAANAVLGRCNANATRFVFLKVWRDKIQMGYYNGSAYVTRTALGVTPQDSGKWELVCGVPGDPTRYEARLNGRLLDYVNWNSSTVPYGVSYRYGGQEMWSGVNDLGNGELMPGRTIFAVRDAAPPPLPGNAMVASANLSSSALAINQTFSNNTTVPFGPSLFTIQSPYSPSFTPGTVTIGTTSVFGIKVPEPGVYTVGVEYLFDASSYSLGGVAPLVLNEDGGVEGVGQSTQGQKPIFFGDQSDLKVRRLAYSYTAVMILKEWLCPGLLCFTGAHDLKVVGISFRIVKVESK